MNFSLPAIFLIYFMCTLIRNYIATFFLSRRDALIESRLLTWSFCTYIHALIVHATERRGWKWPVNVPSVTSSLRLHTQTEELGPDTLRCIFDRGEGGEVLCPWERVIVVSSRLLSSKHIGTIDNIVRNSTSPPGLCRQERINAKVCQSSRLDFFRLFRQSDLII